MMIRIGELVLREACAQAAIWNQLAGQGAGVRIGVNISEQQLTGVDLPVLVSDVLAWSGLPTCSTRPVAVAPSARLWLDAERRSRLPIDHAGVVIGPDVDLAAAERRAIGEIGRSLELDDLPAATSAEVRNGLAQRGLFHVAAHGRFRSDRPLLSTIRLDDGEAPVDEIAPERIGAQLVMLSSCEGGASGTSDGSEVLGLAAVLLARGAGSVVSPLTIVRDLECAEFVAEIYAGLAAGSTVGEAMAEARRHWSTGDRLGPLAVAASFLCIGSTEARLATAP